MATVVLAVQEGERLLALVAHGLGLIVRRRCRLSQASQVENMTPVQRHDPEQDE
jgi:hypothetical protein